MEDDWRADHECQFALLLDRLGGAAHDGLQ